MNFLVVARCGKNGSGGYLSEDGALQMVNMGNEIMKLVDGSRVILLSSSMAFQSVLFINSDLGAFVEEHEVLFSSEDCPVVLPSVLALIKEKEDKVEFVIVVTHYEYDIRLPVYFVRRELGLEKYFPGSPKGGGCVVDCTSGDISRLKVPSHTSVK